MKRGEVVNEADQYLTVEEARALYTAGDVAHDFDHVLRVMQLADRIADAEGADGTVVRLAALLHDVPAAAAADGASISVLAGRYAHHLAAASHARRWLAGRGLDAARTENVVHCIEAHRYRDRSIQPETLEARCLYDADKLDGIGAIGVARAFAFAGAHQSRLWVEPWTAAPPDDDKPQGAEYTPVHEFVYKLQRVLDTLHTPSARTIGAERHAFMVHFFNQLDQEMLGLA